MPPAISRCVSLSRLHSPYTAPPPLPPRHRRGCLEMQLNSISVFYLGCKQSQSCSLAVETRTCNGTTLSQRVHVYGSEVSMCAKVCARVRVYVCVRLVCTSLRCLCVRECVFACLRCLGVCVCMSEVSRCVCVCACRRCLGVCVCVCIS